MAPPVLAHVQWTEERLGTFLNRMQFRLCIMIKHYIHRMSDKEAWPTNIAFEMNLHEEAKFALAVIGHAVLTGVPRPLKNYEVLTHISWAYQSKTHYAWKHVMAAVNHYYQLAVHQNDRDPGLPFPKWWEADPLDEFNLSQWVHEHLGTGFHPELQRLEHQLDRIVSQVSELSEAVEEQMDVLHHFSAAAAEDVASSSRDWAGIHSGLRTQAGMREKRLPLTTKFER